MLPAKVPPFVSSDWLEENYRDVVVADTRWYLDGRSGSDAYRRGHLPGAVHVDLDNWLSGKSSGGSRHPLPTPERFAEGMSELGIGDHSVVVAYDDAGGVIAARLVWMLRVLGRRATVLDGGIAHYSGILETTVPSPERASFTVTPWPAKYLAHLDDVCDGEALVIDARNRDRYRGEFEPVDPRAGHIPGAVNVPCRGNLSEDGRLIDVEAMRDNYADAGVSDARKVISYCGSGVTACHNLLTLELIGFPRAQLYAGSWSEYSNATDRPVAVGPLPL
jgi:thiosulfate/3-mercaptopyruvate sulfurtransferase